MNTHPEILAAHKAHIEASRKLIEAIQLAYPKGTRVKVEWGNGNPLVGKVAAYSKLAWRPDKITIMDEKTSIPIYVDATAHKIEILP